MFAVIVGLSIFSVAMIIICLNMHQRYIDLHQRFVSLNTQHFDYIERQQEYVAEMEAMALNAIKNEVDSYFLDSIITNKVIRTRNGNVEILIGDENNLVEVDMNNEDMVAALDEAYCKFLSEVNNND